MSERFRGWALRVLRITVIVGAAGAGLAAVYEWGIEWRTAGLLLTALGALGQIAVERRSVPSRVRKMLVEITDFALLDGGTYRLTIYQRSEKLNGYVPTYQYSRDEGFKVGGRRFYFGKKLKADLVFPFDLKESTVGAALCEIGTFVKLEDIPEFRSWDQMFDYHTKTRHLPAELVKKFNQHAIQIRSVGSIAFSARGSKAGDVLGVLTIDCTEADGFSRFCGPKAGMEAHLSYWLLQLGALPL